EKASDVASNRSSASVVRLSHNALLHLSSREETTVGEKNHHRPNAERPAVGGYSFSTAVVMNVADSVDDDPIEYFDVDHPFILMLLVKEERSTYILFHGRILQPVQ
ncbi:unnamed protein product, partial [Callosobruchus maculatus]